MLRYLKNHEIDRYKWDYCIENSVNKLIYAFSWYLDIVNPNWEAIVNEDYSVVMPIPIKIKYGYKYIVQPPLTKQLGIFFIFQLDNSVIQKAIEMLIEKFNYIRLNLNNSNNLPDNPIFNIHYKKNHELNLNFTFDELKKKYKRRTYLNLNRANKHNIKCKNGLSFEEFLLFAKKNTTYINRKELNAYFSLLKKLIEKTSNYADVEIYGAYNNNGKLVSVGLFINSINRNFFLYNASTAEGLKAQSMYILTHSYIQHHAGQNTILDCTGSDIKSIAFFLESFGANPLSYQYIQYKNLGFPMKYLLKR